MGYMTKKIIVTFVAAMLAFTNILATPAAVAADCPLCGPARNGDITEVKRLIAAGADINEEDGTSKTALMWAAIRGRAEVIKMLLDAGADANAKNRSGKTALMWAAIRGRAEVIKMLLDAGADANAKNRSGKTALMWAAIRGDAEAAKILLESGANANATDSEGKTVVDYATLKTIPLISEHSIIAECSEVKVDTPLPPEVYADRKLVEIERILDGEDYLSAAIAMKFIRCYSDSNNISLPSEFHFKEAQILLLAQLPQVAKSAVILYLQKSGRDGEHYLEALHLFDELESQ